MWVSCELLRKVPHDVAEVGFIVHTVLSCNFLETEVWHLINELRTNIKL